MLLFKEGCPASVVSVPQFTDPVGDWTACDQWHKFAVSRIKRIDPSVLIVSQTSNYRDPSGSLYTALQWQRSLQHLLADLSRPGLHAVVIGSPAVPRSDGQSCLYRHRANIQECSGPPNPEYVRFDRAEQLAASSVGATFVNVLPWFCTDTCSFVVGRYEVYLELNHITVGYTEFLEGALTRELDLPKP